MKNTTTGRDSDQFTLRFPDGMRNKVKKIAMSNRRSTNAELIFLIEQGIQVAYDKKPASTAVVEGGAT